MDSVQVIGAGLAGSEAALQLARRGIPVRLIEMRPEKMTPAHETQACAELVCSNSLKSEKPTTAAGTLKVELDVLDSRLLKIARQHRVPAGNALAVDRSAFSAAVTAAIEAEPLITRQNAEITALDPERLSILATGPLTSEALSEALSGIVGCDALSFYDASAPIVADESLDRRRIFAASRRDDDNHDYLNSALTQEEYEHFYTELVAAERVQHRDFEQRELFAACRPIEEVARSGPGALRFGALKPVGVDDPRTGRWPYALVQLRAENAQRSAYNLVGFQTNLTFPEQKRVFSLIPGLEHAEFLRYGVMHRNTFVDAPRALSSDLSLKHARNLFLAGQLMGTEGYLEAVAGGLIAALMVTARIRRLTQQPQLPPGTTTLGALLRYATDPATNDYQPMHVNFGLIEPLAPPVRRKRERFQAYHERAAEAMRQWRGKNRGLY
ncbi:MAG: methylenetetrahydrofolate--tRNA-(uracil(54)-C(5))-methyltransferase (FADH(2)-oxidizing) TrmFO [Actinomycetia bacterium]|nr:methylenetetrahydrofolate--tRNA-(uracil(54)-C(5))-methyltransferase (FADH(2)-oxidizing) TrmFO [Actinomycetes bacterium]